MKTCLKHLYDLDAISGVAWLDMDELAEKSSEPWFVERIYSKPVNRAKHGIVR